MVSQILEPKVLMENRFSPEQSAPAPLRKSRLKQPGLTDSKAQGFGEREDIPFRKCPNDATLDWVGKSLKFAVCLAGSGNFEMALRIQTRISGDVFVVRCDGRIVFGDEGAALRARIGDMLSGSPRIVVNLKGVHHVDSGGLGILVGLSVSARNRGGEIKLVNPSQHVNDLLRRTKLDTIISVYRNDEDAVAAFRKRVA